MNTSNESVSLPTGVFEIPGESAIIVNGLPPITLTDGNLYPCHVTNEVISCKNTGFGEWFEGREVRKMFGEHYYRGKVTLFDKETGWYRVVYEDGNAEYLDWDELVEILQPLDITIPLKTLAMRIVRKKGKQVKKSERSWASSHDSLDGGAVGENTGNA